MLLLIAAVASGCAPTAPPARVPDPSETDALLSSTRRISDIEDSARPTLRLIHREGDPEGAVAVSIFPEGGSRESLLLASLLETRLRAAGYPNAELSVHSLGVVAASEAASGQVAADFLEASRRALVTPVDDSDAAMQRANAWLKQLWARQTPPSAVDACLGLLASEGTPEKTTEASRRELERVRKRAVSAHRVGLAALGTPDFLSVVSAAHDANWPEGGSPEDAWGTDENVQVSPGFPQLTLRLALRAADQEGALSVARALRKPDHPIHARLSAVSEDLHPLQPQVTLRPEGACVAMSWTLSDELPAPSMDVLSAAAWAGQEEMQQALRDARTEDESTLALLAPPSAKEAVALAAWTAVRSAAGPRRPTVGIVELRGGPTISESDDAFRKAFKQASREHAKHQVPFATQVEGGQAESWLLVASPCGTSADSPEEAGLRALTVASLSRSLSGTAGVSLEPWMDGAAVGLLAHAAPLRGESAQHQAVRIARVVAQAFSGPALDGRDVAAARSDHLTRVGNDPGRDLMIRVLASPQTSQLSPLGLEQELATLSASDVERARATLAREPLHAAFLASANAEQGEAASSALSQWLAPARGGVTACTEPKLEPGAGGRYTVTTVDEHVVPSSHVGVPAQAPRAVGEALAFLLNRPGGYLDRALRQPGLVASAQAEWLGNEQGGALLISLRASQRELPIATDQTRAVLHELSKGAVSADDANQARLALAAQRKVRQRSPRGRVVELFFAEGPEPSPPTLSRKALLDLTDQLSPERHRISTVIVRK